MERAHLYQRIYNDLLLGIRNKTFPPGSRLPSEKELAEQYNVSRITSKKALEMLAEQNLITRMPGKGSYVLDSDNMKSGKDVNPLVPPSTDGEKRMIGVVLDSFGVTFGCDIVNGIERECRRQGFYTVLKCTYGSMEEETRAIEDLVALGVQGIILMCVQGETYNANVLKLSLSQFPIVLVDRELTGLPIPCVGTDNYKAAKELVELLIDKGHTNICYLSHPFGQTSTVAARFSGYLDCMLEHGLTTNESMWLKNLSYMLPMLGEDEGEECADVGTVEAFIREHPHVTGFFAVNQVLGIMVYKVLCRMGMEREKEVVFFDGIDGVFDSNPVFDHVVQNEYLIGVVAVQQLVDRMKGKEVAKKYCVPYKVVRGTELR